MSKDLNEGAAAELIARGETLTCEFKSDRPQLSDNDICEAVVAFANADGGVLLIGVENDGTITGTSPRHGETTDPYRVQAMVLGRTVPNIRVDVSLIIFADKKVIAVDVPQYVEPCSTAKGLSVRRQIGPDGKPQNVPFYPRDQYTRRIEFGLVDFSDVVLEQCSLKDLSPIEFVRLREVIKQRRSDEALIGLSDEEILKALRFAESRGGKLVPKVAAVLLFGFEEALRRFLPAHQVFFQALDERMNVKVNEALSLPLLHLLQELERRFVARNQEQELLSGLFRVPSEKKQ